MIEVDWGTRLLYQQKKNIRLICITALWKNTELWKQLSLGGWDILLLCRAFVHLELFTPASNPVLFVWLIFPIWQTLCNHMDNILLSTET